MKYHTDIVNFKGRLLERGASLKILLFGGVLLENGHSLNHLLWCKMVTVYNIHLSKFWIPIQQYVATDFQVW